MLHDDALLSGGICSRNYLLLEANMKKGKKPYRKEDYECDSRCVYEYVDCIEAEDGASICKTRERNCFSECRL